jgi:hypothetical protein
VAVPNDRHNRLISCPFTEKPNDEDFIANANAR